MSCGQDSGHSMFHASISVRFLHEQAFLASIPKDTFAGRQYHIHSVMAFLKIEDRDCLLQIHGYWGCLVIMHFS